MIRLVDLQQSLRSRVTHGMAIRRNVSLVEPRRLVDEKKIVYVQMNVHDVPRRMQRQQWVHELN